MSAKQVHNQRYGGMTNDEYVATQAGSFYDCVNVDIRKNSKSFCLSKGGIVSQTIVPGGTEPMGFYAATDVPTYAYESSGSVRKLSDMSVIATATGIGGICNTIDIKDENSAQSVFIAGATGFSKHVIGGALTNNIGVYSPGSLAPKLTQFRPMLKSKLRIYAGDVDGVLRYAIDTQIIDRPLVLEKSDVVVSILELGDQIIIFTQNGSNGRQYFRDGVSKLPNRMIEWFANPPYYAAIFKNQIYVFTQNGFYVSDGYNSQLLHRTSSRLNIPTGMRSATGRGPIRFDTTIDIYYFSLFGSGIYAYGERLPGFGKSLTKENNLLTWIGFFSSSSGFYFYNHTINSPNLTYVHANNYSSTGYIESTPLIGDGFDQKKISKNIRLAYNLPDVSTTGIRVYAKSDDGAYKLLFTSSATNSQTGFNRRVVEESGSRYKKQYKYELFTTDPTKTPEFYSNTIFFNPMEENAY